MGLLTIGKPYSWEDASQHRKYVRDHGVVQFLNTYNRVKGITNDELLWGDEVEYGIFKIDSHAKTVKLSLRAAEILRELDEKERASMHRLEGCTWHPEYGNWMVEATPRQPFSGYAADLVRVERNMRLRRKRILSVLRPGEIAPTMTCFPLMGVGDFVAAPESGGKSASPRDARSGGPRVHGPIANSAYVPDEVINPHPRFGALTKNIRSRRGQNVDIRIPLFEDQNTPEFRGQEVEEKRPEETAPVERNRTSVHGEAESNTRLRSVNETGPVESSPQVATGKKTFARPDVHMDAMAFGMGCCCLQVTFQARDVDESRYMYDQLAVLSPVMLALTAATPVLKGRLVDTDVRWNTIALSVDDRTPAERGLLDEDEAATEAAKNSTMIGDGISRLYKSRYDSISTYLHYCKRREENPMHVLETYNDIPCAVDLSAEKWLIENGVDPAMSHHVAHLFVRDPLVIFDGAVEEVDDVMATEHFENIQSTNWQTVRWKPPPPREHEDSPRIGWRTEFRSMEMQPTDAENAAFVVFVVLVTRVILAFDLNLYIPLSKVDENMKTAHGRDAVRKQKFWWRMHMAPPEKDKSHHHSAHDSEEGSAAHPCTNDDGPTAVDQDHKACDEHTQGHEEMTIEEIMLGKGDYYPGLVPLVYAYLGHIGCDADTMDTVDQYMILICKRASGELKTTSTWIRDFVQDHPDYRQDSVISDSIAHDLVMELKAIGEGEKHAPSLLGDLHVSPVRPKQAYDVPLSSTKVSSACLGFLVQKYTMRERWTERDNQLKATLTEKTTQTSAANGAADASTLRAATHAVASTDNFFQKAPAAPSGGTTSAPAGQVNATASSGGKFGLRATRESSLSYY